MRLTSDEGNLDERQAISCTIEIPNQLFGSAVLSAFELLHGFTKPPTGKPVLLPQEIITAQNLLDAKCKLICILWSKSANNPSLSAVDFLHVSFVMKKK